MNKIISVLLVGVLSCAGVIFFEIPDDYEHTSLFQDEQKDRQNGSITYANYIEVNQQTLQLENEVVQFEIIFHCDDVVDVSQQMHVYYVDETITSVYCLLTDGNRSLLERPETLFYIPYRKYCFITPRIRLSLGKVWFVKFLNDREGKVRIGSPTENSGSFNVHAGDRWYLTLAIPTSSEKTGFSVALSSVNHSMEITQLTRHQNLRFYSAHYHQFSGKYYALKLSWLGGLCLCDVSKEITTKEGSIVEICTAGFRKGSMVVSFPTGEELLLENEEAIRFRYWGNETGTWECAVKARSLYFIMDVWLLYIDIDPHCNIL